MLDLLFTEVVHNPEPYQQLRNEITIPPALCSGFVRPTELDISSIKSRFRDVPVDQWLAAMCTRSSKQKQIATGDVQSERSRHLNIFIWDILRPRRQDRNLVTSDMILSTIILLVIYRVPTSNYASYLVLKCDLFCSMPIKIVCVWAAFLCVLFLFYTDKVMTLSKRYKKKPLMFVLLLQWGGMKWCLLHKMSYLSYLWGRNKNNSRIWSNH